MGLWGELKKNELRTWTTREVFMMLILSGVFGIAVTILAVMVS